MFLVCALKNYTIGIDTVGYKTSYYNAQFYPWGDYSYFYLEPGYIFLEKLFVTIGFDYYLFAGILYAANYITLYFFIKRYSRDKTLSVIIYLCFNFFTFNLSGLRNMFALAICLWAFMSFHRIRNTMLRYIISSLFIVAALLIHESAYIFFIMFLVDRLRISIRTIWAYFFIPALALLFRNPILTFINGNIKTIDHMGDISFTGATLFLSGVLILYYFSRREYAKTNMISRLDSRDYPYGQGMAAPAECEDHVLALEVRLIYCGLCLQIFFGAGENILSRLSMMMQIFLITAIPNSIRRFDGITRSLITLGLLIFLVLYYYFSSLSANMYSTVPYSFFWQ